MSHRIVVIGYGMAGSRFVEDLRARDPEHRYTVTVLGAEQHAAYNRILLSDVLAGRADADAIALTAPGWAGQAGIDLRLGTTATSIDRARRRVLTDTGEQVPYDTLVLATGSAAWVPPIDGLHDDAGQLRPGVTVFRTLEDCHAILAAARGATHAAVLGGGLLGLEAARGLAGRGLAATVLHFADHVMERQLDTGAGAVLRSTMGNLGVQVRTGTSVREVPGTGRIRELVLTDGSTLHADLLVIACGVRPNTELAAAAGLHVENGIVVDDALRTVVVDGDGCRTTDEHVYAIGECAEHAGQVYGLVAPAWEQARIAADQITGVDSRYPGSRVVTRLKAVGVDLAAMGETGADDGSFPDGAEVLQFSDPVRGTYKKVIIRDGRITGAILLGQIDTVGNVTQLFDRGAPAPSDRLSLLFGDRAAPAPAASPALMPDRATVCQCNGVTKGAITACVLAGARTVTDIARATRATTGCGSCRDTVVGIADWLAKAEPATALEEVTA